MTRGGREEPDDERTRPRSDGTTDDRRTGPDVDAQNCLGTAACGLFARGVAFGVLAYLVGYALVFGISLVERSGADGNALTMAGWLFYNAHFVGVEIPLTGESVNVLAAAGDENSLTVPPVVYYLVPPAALTLAGYGAARTVRTTSRAVTAVAGAGIAAGYLPLAVAGAFMFTFDLPQFGMALRPDLTASVLLAGIVYPVAFGAAAGVATGSDDPDGRSAHGATTARQSDRYDPRCGNCEQRVASDDRFCRRCGVDLAE
ncbi:hypothetical protein BRC81_01550 [Halobacteriales archaeon QS_1_68_20]|nr:MAG: hypothetical protein BRC81_01550 [Halobacteriales archaeon QS_1_68_20]